VPAQSGAQTVVSRLLTFDGLDRVLRSLSESDLKLFMLVSASAEGASYSEIEKHLHLNSSQIDDAAARLKDNLLVFVLKNRKHLNNKLDRVHPFQPVCDMLHPVADKVLMHQLEWPRDAILKKRKIPDDLAHVMQQARSAGHIMNLQEFGRMVSAKKIDQLLNGLVEHNLVRVFHLTAYPFTTILSFRNDALSGSSRQKQAPLSETGICCSTTCCWYTMPFPPGDSF
jgi:hypothetical protein